MFYIKKYNHFVFDYLINEGIFSSEQESPVAFLDSILKKVPDNLNYSGQYNRGFFLLRKGSNGFRQGFLDHEEGSGEGGIVYHFMFGPGFPKNPNDGKYKDMSSNKWQSFGGEDFGKKIYSIFGTLFKDYYINSGKGYLKPKDWSQVYQNLLKFAQELAKKQVEDQTSSIAGFDVDLGDIEGAEDNYGKYDICSKSNFIRKYIEIGCRGGGTGEKDIVNAIKYCDHRTWYDELVKSIKRYKINKFGSLQDIFNDEFGLWDLQYIKDIQTHLARLGVSLSFEQDGKKSIKKNSIVITDNKPIDKKDPNSSRTNSDNTNTTKSNNTNTTKSNNTNTTKSEEKPKKNTGSNIGKLQQKLKDLNFYKGNVDGIIGKLTISAIREFQKKYESELKVDGIYGPKTAEKLREITGEFIEP